MKKLLPVLLIVLMGCSTVATQSEDGKILIIKGLGGSKAKFQNGAEIEKGTNWPKFPEIELRND